MTGLAAPGCQVADRADTDFDFHLDPERGVLELREGTQRVFDFRYLPRDADSMDVRERSACFVHPIFGLDGEVLTDLAPQDHHHHRGLSLMWPIVRRAGVRYDLWEARGIRTVFVRWMHRAVSEDRARLSVESEWRLDDGTRVCREVLHFTVHRASSTGRAIDVRYELTPLGEALTLQGQTKKNKGYGGLTVRFAPPKQGERPVITTERGVQPDRLGARFAWAMLSARFGEAEARSGIAIFSHPDKAKPAPRWMLRHYGLLNVSWPGVEAVELSEDVTRTLRYRLWIARPGHADDTSDAARAAYRDYVRSR